MRLAVNKLGFIFAAVFSALTAAEAEQRIWGSHSASDWNIATDCGDCLGTELVGFYCQAGSNWISVELPGLRLSRPASEGSELPMVVTVGQSSFDYKARVVYSELYGDQVKFDVRRGDPLIAALMAGTHFRIAVRHDTLEIPLNGAASAIGSLLKGCS